MPETAMRFRAMRPEDIPAVTRLLRANGHLLVAEGQSALDLALTEGDWLEGMTSVVERNGAVVAFVKYRPSEDRTSDLVVEVFVTDPALHNDAWYVRCAMLSERWARRLGFERLIAWVPAGHDRMRRFLMRFGYMPFATDEQGRTFYVKEISHVRVA